MTAAIPHPEDDDRGELPPWTDPTEYSPEGPLGSGFWTGCGDWTEDGPLRGWWIRRLFHAAKEHAPDGNVELWSRMVLWLSEEGQEGGYIRFVTSEYFGPLGPVSLQDASGGYWRLAEKALEADLPRAFAWAVAAVGYKGQTLDEFLEDPDRSAGVAPREPAGSKVLERHRLWDARNRLISSRLRVWRQWPRACTACGESFVDKRRQVKRCPGCRGKRARR